MFRAVLLAAVLLAPAASEARTYWATRHAPVLARPGVGAPAIGLLPRCTAVEGGRLNRGFVPAAGGYIATQYLATSNAHCAPVSGLAGLTPRPLRRP